MVTTYFKRFRMESTLHCVDQPPPKLVEGVRLLPWSASVLRDHARVKFESFRNEIDASVFPCLARKDGCFQLMKDLAKRKDFVAEATWLAIHQQSEERWLPVGTIQGLRCDKFEGAIQNLGIVPAFRGLGLGSVLLWHSLAGFAKLGCRQVSLEVTVQNSAAIRLYERLGFRRVETVFKIAEVVTG
jgi:ribosomal protein S18 acetylase RimI-like enzyme